LLLLPLVAGALAHADERRATLFGVEGGPCLMRLAAGERACPGCGLSRGTVLAMHGEVGRSWNVHPAGIVVVALCAIGALVHAHLLLVRRRTRLHDWAFRAGWVVFGAGIVGAWLVRLVR